MLAAGGICEFTTPAVPSEHRVAQISPAAARAPDQPLPVGNSSSESYHERLSEGLLVPREPAYADERSQDGEAKSASE